MKGEDRANDPAPAGDFNREPNDATSDEPVGCERCGEPLVRGYRFCSQACFQEWKREDWEPPPKPMTFEEMEAEMRDVFARLATYPEETS